MDKVKKFLEAHVQWVALGLGVAFLGWMVYTYVVLKPVSSAVGNNPATSPGDIYTTIMSGPGATVENGLKSNVVPPGIGPQKDYSVVVGDLFNQRSTVAPVLATPWVPISPQISGEIKDDGPTTQQIAKIVKLPTAPAVTNLQVSWGHSNVPAPTPVVAAGAPAAPPPGAAPAVQAVDKSWRTIAGTFPTAALAKAFADVGIVPGTPNSNTAILRVVLVRNERMANGNWGPDTEIAPLEINQLPPLPPNNASFADQTDFLTNVAEKSFITIARPPFYQVLQGDAWYEPGTTNPNEVAAAAESDFDPLHPLSYTGDPSKLLPSEQKAYNDAKAAADAAAARKAANPGSSNNPPPAPPGQPDNIGGGRRSGGVVADPGRDAGGNANPLLLAADYPAPVDGGRPPGPAYLLPGGEAGAPGAAVTALPSGSFDPSQQPEFKIWAHDPTVQAGRTYRYKLKYIISNPVARTTGVCAPALSNQFYIESDFSAWTDPVSVESDTNFFAVDAKHGIHFDVFKWRNGSWQMQNVVVNPGDMVGSIVKDPTTGEITDFTTGWTLVDVREDPNSNDNKVLILVSDNGTVLIKEISIDAHSAAHRKLWQLLAPAKPAMAGMPAGANP